MGSQHFRTGLNFWTGLRYASTVGLLTICYGTAIGGQPSQAQLPPAPPAYAPNTYTYTSNPSTVAATYRVIVDSSSPQLLQRVTQIEPTAFLRNFADGRVRIQAGAFESVSKAQEAVDTLGRAGIPATAYDRDGKSVYTTNPNSPTIPLNPGDTPQPVAGMPKGYYALVAVDRDLVGITYEKLRKLGITQSFITVGQHNLGWHVSVGVYPNRGDADRMSQFMRDKGGLDARTFYEH